MEALRVATILISGIYAGAVVVYMIVLPPLFALIPAEHGVPVKRRIDPLNDRVWPPVLIPGMVLAVLLLVLDDDASTAATAVTAVGLAGLAAVPIVTRGFVIPVNQRIHALDPEGASEAERAEIDTSFRHLHRQWARRHAVRLGFAVLAFASFTIAFALA